MKVNSNYTNRKRVKQHKPEPALVKLRREFHRIMKDLATREGRSIGEAIEWLCKDGFLYREEHKDDPTFKPNANS